MPPMKKAERAAAIAKSSSKAGKKKKWSRGKTRETLNNQVLFDKATYEKLLQEVPAYKMITPSIMSDRLKINGSLARAGISLLEEKGLIKRISRHGSQLIYTRATGAKVAEVVEATGKAAKKK